MIQVLWTPRAQADFDEMYDYLCAEAGVRIADAQSDLLLSRLVQLQNFPDSGVSAKPLPCKKLFVNGSPYIVYYREAKSRIELLAIRHAARMPFKHIPKR